MLDSAIFWTFAVVSVVAALGAVLSRSIIYAALCLIAVFMSIAGFFMLNNADFLAIAQIIIYAVGLTIIMLFAIMFTGDRPTAQHKVSQAAKVAYGIVVAYVFALLVRGVSVGFVPSVPASNSALALQLAQEGSTNLLGMSLFKDYALPFELASMLLLSAMIGAIVIAKKKFVESDEDVLGDMRLPLDQSSAPTADAVKALRADRELEQQQRKALLNNASDSESEAAASSKS